MASKERMLVDTPAAQLIEVDMREHGAALAAAVASVEGRLLDRPTVVVFGRECRQPRDVGFFSDESPGYTYAHRMMPAQALCTSLKKLLYIVNALFGADYNGILVNRYRTGSDNVGSHADSMDDLDPRAGVVTLSYGATRIFRLRDGAKRKVGDFALRSGFAIQMRGATFQQTYKHEVPVQRRVREPRFSFTFRRHSSDDRRRAAQEQSRSPRARDSSIDIVRRSSPWSSERL